MIKRFIEYIFWKYVYPENELFWDDDIEDKTEMDKVFYQLSESDDLKTLLRTLMKHDKERYFKASSDRQQLIRGQYMRALVLYRRITNQSERRSKVESAKSKFDKSSFKKGGRYAT